MNVDLMRKIDYFVGVPLCFGLTMLRKMTRRKLRSPEGTFKNVLFIELSEMGSAILVDPAMKKLKIRHNANLFFVIFEKNKPSLELLNTVEEKNIFCIRETSLAALFIDTVKLLFWTRKQGIDTVIDLELFSRFTAILSILTGVKSRVGFYAFHNEGLYRGEFLSHKVAYNPHVHIAKNFIALVNSLALGKEEVPFSKSLISPDEIKLDKKNITEDEKGSLIKKLNDCFPDIQKTQNRKIVLINPNASELLIQRRWMPEHYEVLIQTILDNHKDIVILITGSKSENSEAEALKKKVDRVRCFNIAGFNKFKELPALYCISHLMVTNDSGPGHFSAITGLPVFVLFGPETPHLYGSLGNSKPIYAGLVCSPCVSAWNHRKTACHDNVCLQVIKPERVYEDIKKCLEADKWISIKP